MKKKEGQYTFRIWRGWWGIYRYVNVTPTRYGIEPVPGEKQYESREDARKRVYQLNGWNYRP